MAKAKLASNATASAPETVELSRGQKAAQTRRANDAKREAEAAQAATQAAADLERLKKRAAANVRKTVPTKEARAASLAKLAKEQAAAKAEADAKAKALSEQAEVATEEKAFALMPRHELRALAVGEALGGERMGRRYAEKLSADFPLAGGWWNAKRADASDKGNVGPVIKALFEEQDAYFTHFKDNHAKLVLRGVRKGRANPSRYWGLAKLYAQEAIATDTSGNGSGKVRPPLEALRANLPALYLRVNNSEAFLEKGAKGEKLRTAAFKLGEALQAVLTAVEWDDLQAKVEAKGAK